MMPRKIKDVCPRIVILSIKSNLFYSFLVFTDDLIKSVFLSNIVEQVSVVVHYCTSFAKLIFAIYGQNRKN